MSFDDFINIFNLLIKQPPRWQAVFFFHIKTKGSVKCDQHCSLMLKLQIILCTMHCVSAKLCCKTAWFVWGHFEKVQLSFYSLIYNQQSQFHMFKWFHNHVVSCSKTHCKVHALNLNIWHLVGSDIFANCCVALHSSFTFAFIHRNLRFSDKFSSMKTW